MGFNLKKHENFASWLLVSVWTAIPIVLGMAFFF